MNLCSCFFLIFGGHRSFLWDYWYPYFGLLVMLVLGFKARVDSLAHVLPHLRTTDSSDSPLVWHLLTVWRSVWQLNLFDPRTWKCVCRHWWFGGLNPWPYVPHAWHCKPLVHSGSELFVFDISMLNKVNRRHCISGYVCKVTIDTHQCPLSVQQ